MNRKFKGIWIEANIWLSKELLLTEKCLLAEIDSLSDEDEGCFATNQYLADFLGVTKGTVANMVSNLSSKGFLSVVIEDGYKRTMRLTKSAKDGVHPQMKGGSSTDEPMITNLEISIEKKVSKDTGELPLKIQSLEDKKGKKTNKERPIDEKSTASGIIAYLNEKALRQFPTEGKRADSNQKIIIARLRDGFTEDELKRVIDCKVSKWLDDPKMKDYLKPSTLFRPGHCSDYLEEAKSTQVFTKETNGLQFDTDLNGQTETYKAWWETLKGKYPNVATEIRFMKASEFKEFVSPEPSWFPIYRQRVGAEMNKKRINQVLADLESNPNRKRVAEGGLYAHLTTQLTEMAL